MPGLAGDTVAEPLWVLVAAALAGLLVSVPLRALATRGTAHRGTVSRILLGLAAILGGAGLGTRAFGLSDATDVLQLAALVALIVGLVGLAGFVFFDLLLARVAVAPILRDLLEAATAVVVVLLLLRAWGVNVLGLVTTSAVLTAVVGLAMQTTLANLFGGLSLQLDRSVAQGDWVRVGSDTGRVAEVGWRATRLVTPDGTTVVIPNGQLVTGQLVNLSRPAPPVRRMLEVGFHYRHAPNEVRAALLTAVRDVPGVLAQPAPDCVVVAFGDSAVVYGVLYWSSDHERERHIAGEMRSRIWYAAHRAGFEIPFPIRTLLHASADGDERAEARERTALFERIPLFQALTEVERERMTQASRRLVFGAGEAIVTQGEPGDSLYLVVHGRVGVYLTVDGATRELATLGAGDLFGEMSLLTGEPRSASCVALGDATCEVIGRDVLQELLAANPAIADALARHLAERRVAIEASREGLTAAARSRRTHEEHHRLLPRIRDFLGAA